MNTINIDITLDELSLLSKGLFLVEKQEEERDAIMDAALQKRTESPYHADDLVENTRIVEERNELLSNLHRKLTRATRELAAK